MEASAEVGAVQLPAFAHWVLGAEGTAMPEL